MRVTTNYWSPNRREKWWRKAHPFEVPTMNKCNNWNLIKLVLPQLTSRESRAWELDASSDRLKLSGSLEDARISIGQCLTKYLHNSLIRVGSSLSSVVKCSAGISNLRVKCCTLEKETGDLSSAKVSAVGNRGLRLYAWWMITLVRTCLDALGVIYFQKDNNVCWKL